MQKGHATKQIAFLYVRLLILTKPWKYIKISKLSCIIIKYTNLVVFLK